MKNVFIIYTIIRNTYFLCLYSVTLLNYFICRMLIGRARPCSYLFLSRLGWWFFWVLSLFLWFRLCIWFWVRFWGMFRFCFRFWLWFTLTSFFYSRVCRFSFTCLYLTWHCFRSNYTNNIVTDLNRLLQIIQLWQCSKTSRVMKNTNLIVVLFDKLPKCTICCCYPAINVTFLISFNIRMIFGTT